MKRFNLINKTLAAVLVSGIMLASCADLSVDNKNSPKAKDVLASSEDVVSLLDTGALQWWQATQGTYVLGLMTGSDYYTCSHGNFDMRNRGNEPRLVYDNSPTASGDTKDITEAPWYGFYSSLTQANDVLKLIKGGTVLKSSVSGVSNEDFTKFVSAEAQFLQAISLANLAIYFDKAFVVDEDSDLAALNFSTYAEVTAAAVAKFEKAKATLATAPAAMTMDRFNGFSLSKADFGKLINTFQAWTIVMSSRTAAENTAADWAKVATLTASGIDFDFSPEGDDNYWFSYPLLYHNVGNWVRVDQRIVKGWDNTAPFPWPNNTNSLPAIKTNDMRVDTTAATADNGNYDFFYDGAAVPFRADRGYYWFSNYKNGRYGYHSFFTTAEGAMPYFLKAENDLLRAEALVRTSGDKAVAANLVNNSRVTRGNLTPLTAATTNADFYDAIFYERQTELYLAGWITGLCDMRRTDRLQAGTPKQMPVPAKELLVLKEELYTFGGASGKTLAQSKAPIVSLKAFNNDIK